MPVEIAAPVSWTALALLAFGTSITPGPNNLMLLNSGARFGLVRTAPHLLGIILGTCLLLVLACIGIGALMQAWPQAALALKLVGVSYLLWLSVRLLRSALKAPMAAASGANQRPMGTLQAALFQFVNPKAWMMAIAAAASISGASLFDTAALILMFVSINLPCITLWAALGAAMVHLLRTPASHRAFNVSVALLLAASALLML